MCRDERERVCVCGRERRERERERECYSAFFACRVHTQGVGWHIYMAFLIAGAAKSSLMSMSVRVVRMPSPRIHSPHCRKSALCTNPRSPAAAAQNTSTAAAAWQEHIPPTETHRTLAAVPAAHARIPPQQMQGPAFVPPDTHPASPPVRPADAGRPPARPRLQRGCRTRTPATLMPECLLGGTIQSG